MESFYFYDNDPWGFPEDACHFFNILVICIAVPADCMPKNIENIWYLDELMEPRPKAIHIYADNTIDNYIIDAFPHSVVEVYNKNNVCFYDMLDFETTDFWEIE